MVLSHDLQIEQDIPLPNFKKILNIKDNFSKSKKNLEELLESLADAERPLPQLAKLCCTVDQASYI